MCAITDGINVVPYVDYIKAKLKSLYKSVLKKCLHNTQNVCVLVGAGAVTCTLAYRNAVNKNK